MALELTGTVKRISEIQTFASGFQKREMVIVTSEQYPQPISIDFLKDKGDLLNSLKEGDEVTVSINIGGREWTSPQGEVKYFNSITGWKIETVASAAQPAQNNTSAPPTAEKSQEPFQEDDEDLPF